MFATFHKLTLFATALLALTFALSAQALPLGKRADMQKRHFTGQATFFAPGLGACGWTSAEDDFIVALSSSMYDENPHCGEQVAILNQQKGIWQYATVVDSCPGCSEGSLDMSPSLFAALNDGDMDQGVFPIGWHFLN